MLWWLSLTAVRTPLNKGKAESGEFFVVDVWKKDGDTWKLANRFVSKTNSESRDT